MFANLGKIKAWVHKRREAAKKRKEAPLEAISLIREMQTSLTAIDKRLEAVEKQNAEQTQRLQNLDCDTADLLLSQLTREHDYFVKKGCCPTSDKERIGRIYERYKARGRNHISDCLIDDLTQLPIS